MGWRPWEVRRATAGDMLAAQIGWARAQGADVDGKQSKFPTASEREYLAEWRRKHRGRD